MHLEGNWSAVIIEVRSGILNSETVQDLHAIGSGLLNRNTLHTVIVFHNPLCDSASNISGVYPTYNIIMLASLETAKARRWIDQAKINVPGWRSAIVTPSAFTTGYHFRTNLVTVLN
jgi:hypothetical protein